MILGPLALAAASAFTGAAVYVNAVEQPARLDLEPAALLAEWKPSYKRATIMQVALALVGAGLGFAVFASTRDWRWLAGALILLTLFPYTILGVMPTNRMLMALPAGSTDPSIRERVARWGRLHAVRSGIGIAAVLVYLWASQTVGGM